MTWTFNKTTAIQISSYLLMSSFIFGMFLMNMVPMVFIGFILFLAMTSLNGLLKRKIQKTKWLTVFLVSIGTLITLLLLGMIGYWSLKSGTTHIRHEGIDGLFYQLSDIINKIRDYLPTWISEHIPSNGITIKAKAIEIFQERSQDLLHITDGTVRFIAKFFIGVFLGIIIGYSTISHNHSQSNELKPLSKALLKRIKFFYEIFCQVVMAQVKISLLNTFFTGVFLLIVFPLFSIHLPYSKTIVLLTFVFGLLPVIGNLITNSIIVLISLTISFPTAIASLCFLIAVHKTEYFLNAKIVGHQIQTSIWEILIAMVVMEHIFGLAGVIVSPILYGYIKKELAEVDLI